MKFGEPMQGSGQFTDFDLVDRAMTVSVFVRQQQQRHSQKVTTPPAEGLGQDTMIGVASLNLHDLPCGITVTRRLPLSRGDNSGNNSGGSGGGYVHVSVTAEGFGVSALLFMKSDLVHQYVRAFHSPQDILRNAVICMATGNVYYGLAEALDDMVASMGSSSGNRNKKKKKEKRDRKPVSGTAPDTSRILILFPGRYMLQGPYKLDERFDDLLLFGMGGEDGSSNSDRIMIESFDENKALFDIEKPISIILHNLNFAASETTSAKTFICRERGVRIHANAMDLQDIAIYKPNEMHAQEQQDKELLVKCSVPSDIFISHVDEDEVEPEQYFAVLRVSQFRSDVYQ